MTISRLYDIYMGRIQHPTLNPQDPKDDTVFAQIEDWKAGKKTNLTTWQQYILHKYFHSISVFEAGVDIILSEKILQKTPEYVKNDWYEALLMHDIGRAFEIHKRSFCDDGPQGILRVLRYPHGTFGMMLLYKQGVRSLHVLLPVLIHDRINIDPFNMKPEDVINLPQMATLPRKVKKIIQDLFDAYQQMNPDEQELVRLGCKLVVDADQLSNLRNFEKMMSFAHRDYRPLISEPVKQAIKERRYVSSRDRKTFADYSVSYMAWMLSKEHFPAMLQELLTGNVLQYIVTFTIEELTRHTSEDLTQLQQDLHVIRQDIESYLSDQIKNQGVFELSIPQEKEKAQILSAVLDGYMGGL